MYKQNFVRGPKNRFRSQRSRYSGSTRQGGARRIKTFDPSRMVQDKPTLVEVEEIYTPMHTFADFAVSQKLKASIERRGYKIPTPIQDQAIPEILNGKDVVGVANTGTGKTAAFLIPLINKVLHNPRERVLIVAPTRELAVQIEQELMLFARSLGIYSAICIGGVSLYSQIKSLSRKPQFVIGTPGRLLDLSNQKKVQFREFGSVVLDEVDHMLDMGFIRDVQKIVT